MEIKLEDNKGVVLTYDNGSFRKSNSVTDILLVQILEKLDQIYMAISEGD